LIAAQGTRPSALRYTGEQTDDDTGLVYLRARWYDSATGRFTTRDPFPGLAVFPRTQHPYVYALNNPINLTDPSGEFVDTIFDIFMVGLDVYFLLSDGLYYLQHPCADASERDKVLGGDLLALAADALLMVVPFAPSGAGLANKGLLILTRVGYQVAPLIRVGQATAKGVKVGTHLAQASKGGGRFVKGSSGGSGGKYSFPGPDALAKKLGVSREEFHKTIKPAIKDDFRREMEAIGSTNPDIGIDVAGNIVLKHPTTGKTIETGVPLSSYGR
jgi:RHS repeat-associated protein